MRGGVEQSGDAQVPGGFAYETVVAEDVERIREAPGLDAEEVITDRQRAAPFKDGDGDVGARGGGTACGDGVGECQTRGAVGGVEHEGVADETRLAGTGGRDQLRHLEASGAFRQHAVVGGHGQDHGFAGGDGERVVHRVEHAVEGGDDGAHDHDAVLDVAEGVLDRVAERVVADEARSRLVGDELAVGDDGDGTALRGGAGADDDERADGVREVAVVGQHVEKDRWGVDRHMEGVFDGKEEAVVRDGVVENVREDLPVGELVEQSGDGGVMDGVRRREIDLSEAGIGHPSRGHDSQAIIGNRSVDIDFDIVDARIEGQDFVLICRAEIGIRGRRVVDADDEHGDERRDDAAGHAVGDGDGECVDAHFAARQRLEVRRGRRVVCDGGGGEGDGARFAAERRDGVDEERVEAVDVRVVGQEVGRGNGERRVFVGGEEVGEHERAGQRAAQVEDMEIRPAGGTGGGGERVHHVEAVGKNLFARIGRRDERVENAKAAGVVAGSRGVVDASDFDGHRPNGDGAVAIFDDVPEGVVEAFAFREAVEEVGVAGAIDKMVFARIVAQGQCDRRARGSRDLKTVGVVQNRPHALLHIVVNVAHGDGEGVVVHHGNDVIAGVGWMTAVVGDDNFRAGGKPVSGGMHRDWRGAFGACEAGDGVDCAEDSDDLQAAPSVVGIDVVVIGEKTLCGKSSVGRRFVREHERKPGHFRPDHDANRRLLGDVGDHVGRGDGRIVAPDDANVYAGFVALRGQAGIDGLPDAEGA